MDKNKTIEEIIAENIKPIYSFVYRLTRGHEDSDDLTQETFIKVWKKLDKYDSTKSFKTWIFTIARNTFIDWSRRKKIKFDTEPELEIIDQRPIPDQLFETLETKADLEKILDSLPPGYKEVVILHHDDDLTFAEIAEITGRSLNTVKSQYRRALIILRQLIEVAPK